MEKKQTANGFDEHAVLHDLKHYLPAQAPLKDFVHHNTLHAFQYMPFHEALQQASGIFGYKTYLGLKDFRGMYQQGKIPLPIIESVLERRTGKAGVKEWTQKMLQGHYDESENPRLGSVRDLWKKTYKIDLDSMVHPILFRLVCSYLDQGISIWSFPVTNKTFLAGLRELEKHTEVSIFKSKRAKKLLLENTCEIHYLLGLLIGNDESVYAHYLFDQQFAHQGWSGMVAVVEENPGSLLDARKVSLHDLIVIELLLEIDALEDTFKGNWQPLGSKTKIEAGDFLAPVGKGELFEVYAHWQEAFEWSYYDQVLKGLATNKAPTAAKKPKTFQAVFCIDDRECSLRRYIEQFDPNSETFAAAGFFGVEFFYQPDTGHFYTKLCPAPVTPKFLIKEEDSNKQREVDFYFSKRSHTFFWGWLITHTIGFWSAFKLFLNVFRPSFSPATASSLKHMDKFSKLTIENQGPAQKENGLQIGFTVEEMTDRIEALLKMIGMTSDFAPIVYIVGHGASSVNNPHYSAYDCGACCGRAGSVNARAASFMANHPKVRELLRQRGIDIPATTYFIGALHDTTRDEVVFYDEDILPKKLLEQHDKHEVIFDNALDLNAKERSRRFESIDTRLSARVIHDKIRVRSVSIFEPRPELNHATNALCIVGRRALSRGLYLDRRSFLNSYNYLLDPEGKYLLNILNAVAPVCGGINLEYYFSKVDNQKLGAGTKLPHNVMGLFGVANGIEGDLRSGLPSQMIEMHDPVRILVIVEHDPEVVLNTVKRNPATYEWFFNQWVNLVVIEPNSKSFFRFEGGRFHPHKPVTETIPFVQDFDQLLASTHENLPVYLLNE